MVYKINLPSISIGASGWGDTLNNYFNAATGTEGGISLGFGGTVSVNVTSASVNINENDAKNFRISIQGTVSPAVDGSRIVTIPTGVTGYWFVTNGSNIALNIYNLGGVTGVLLKSGYSYIIYSNGTACIEAPNNIVHKTGDTMTGALALPSNGLTVGTNQLYVSGGNVYSSGSFTAVQNVTAQSDIRTKENIKTIENAIDIVEQLFGVSYTRKDNGIKNIGLIAQDVEQILPEVVHKDEYGILSIAYGNIVAVLINAIKELSDRVKELEGK